MYVIKFWVELLLKKKSKKLICNCKYTSSLSIYKQLGRYFIFIKKKKRKINILIHIKHF